MQADAKIKRVGIAGPENPLTSIRKSNIQLNESWLTGNTLHTL